MQIAHLTSAHPRDDVRIRLKECLSLVRAGHSVTLLVADGLGNEVVQGLSIVDVGCPTGRLQRMLLTPRRMLARARGLQVDVYHLHDPELLPIGAALRRSGKRVVFDAHEDVPKQILAKHYLPHLVRRTISRIFAAYERHVCARLDGVIAATPTIRDKFLPIHPRTVDINNYPLPGELDSIPATGRPGAEVCYVGGIASIRGAHEMVAAMELCSHPGVRLNLVGTFSEANLELQLRAMPAWKHVVAWGQQDRVGVREVLARSRIGLVTLHPTANYVESLPIKMFEYMAAGVAVVASDFPLWRSIVSEAECGVCVDPMDSKAIATAIDELLANPARTAQLGENGRRAIADRFNWRIEEGKLLDLYASLTGQTA